MEDSPVQPGQSAQAAQAVQILTHSRMSTAKTCPRRHWYAYELGLRPIRRARPLRIGTAVHAGVGALMRKLPIADAVEITRQSYRPIQAWCYDDDKLHEWFCEEQMAMAMVQGYFDNWCDKTTFKSLRSEWSFRVPIRNPETGRPTQVFWLAGKIDGVVELEDKRLAVYELKTCGDDLGPDSDFWLRLRIDHQISGYILGAFDVGCDVQTVLYDAIRKPRLKPKAVPLLDDDGLKIVLDLENGGRAMTKAGKPRQAGNAEQGFVLQTRQETPQEYGERLAFDIADRPEFYFARMEIPRLDSDIEDFKHELWQMQQQLRQAQVHGRHFRNTQACIMFGRCPYLDICHSCRDLEAGPPEGFEVVHELHPELVEEEDEGDTADGPP